MVQPELVLPAEIETKADHKVHAIGQRRDVVDGLAHVEGAPENAAERPQLRVSANEPVRSAAPGITTISLTQVRFSAWIARSHVPSRHTLTVSSIEPVRTRPSVAAAALHTQVPRRCSVSVTTRRRTAAP